MQNTTSEENYLKAIYGLMDHDGKYVNTNLLADKLNTRPSSTTEMIKKLADKQLVDYIKYKGVSLTNDGKHIALNIIRKHRLWESFLVEKLNYSWHEVHEVAEQLEHVKCEQLIDKLDDFLGNPIMDPHGDLIPDKLGRFRTVDRTLLLHLGEGQQGVFVGVKDSSDSFLRFLDKKNLVIGSKIKIIAIENFDQSRVVVVNDKEILITEEVARNIFLNNIVS